MSGRYLTGTGGTVAGGTGTEGTGTEGSETGWSPFWRDPHRAVILADFDGTLSTVVEDRDHAVPLPGVAQVIEALAGRFGLVGVISGRPVEFLASRLPNVPGLVLVGLYGLQRLTEGHLTVAREAAPWAEVVARAVAEARRTSPPGLEVEDKGLSMALHWRRAPAAGEWAARWAEGTAARAGLVAQVGRRSVELLPPVPMDKGMVVEELSEDAGAVCFLGDDVGDLPAFAALQRMRGAGKVTVAVGVSSPEQPPELPAAVDVLVDGPAGALDILRTLAGLAPGGPS